MLNLKCQFRYLPQRASLARVGSHMVQISLQTSGGKVVFSGGFHGTPPLAPTGVKVHVPWSLKSVKPGAFNHWCSLCQTQQKHAVGRGGTKIFLVASKGQNAILRGAKIKKNCQKCWFWPFFLLRGEIRGGGKNLWLEGANAPMPPLMLPLKTCKYQTSW